MIGSVGAGFLGAEAERSLHPIDAVGYHDGQFVYCLACSPFNRITAGCVTTIYSTDGEYGCQRCGKAINARVAQSFRQPLEADEAMVKQAGLLVDATGWSIDRAAGYCFGRRARTARRPYMALSESEWFSDKSDFAVGYRHGYGQSG